MSCFWWTWKKGIYGNSQSGMIIFNLFNASYQSKSIINFLILKYFQIDTKIWHVSLLQNCVPIIFGRTNNLRMNAYGLSLSLHVSWTTLIHIYQSLIKIKKLYLSVWKSCHRNRHRAWSLCAYVCDLADCEVDQTVYLQKQYDKWIYEINNL